MSTVTVQQSVTASKVIYSYDRGVAVAGSAEHRFPERNIRLLGMVGLHVKARKYTEPRGKLANPYR